MIEISVSGFIHCTTSEAIHALKDYSTFPEWWPSALKVKNGSNQSVSIKPLPFVTIVMEQMDCLTGNQVNYKYIKGPFRGTGTWSIYEIHHDPPLVEVTYEIKLRPVNLLIKIVSLTSFFKNKHINDIKGIIRKLDQRCRGA